MLMYFDGFSINNVQFAFLENLDSEQSIRNFIARLISQIVMKSGYISVRDIIEDYFYYYNSKKLNP